jgi:hypothetical protein
MTPQQVRVALPAAVLVGGWIVTTAALVWVFAATAPGPALPTWAGLLTVAALGVDTAALLWSLGRAPIAAVPAAARTRRTAFTVAVVVALLLLVPLGFVGQAVLGVLAVVAVAVLVRLRQRLDRRELGYAAALGATATVGGLVGWAATRVANDLVWAGVQLPLVVLTLLAGWRAARHAGCAPAELGTVRLLVDGAGPALRSALFGIVLALPWALGNLVFGQYLEDRIVEPWQPLVALLPGVAEESWARAFVVPILFLAFRRVATAPVALRAAAVAATYWFAFLHTPTSPVGVVLIGSLWVLPMTYLWLRRDLETAIGFHVCIDFVRFVAAYLVLHGAWLGG